MASSTKAEDSGGGSEGPATDRNNAPVIDPTRNVLDLVAAAIARQDDLREQESKHARELAAVSSDYLRQERQHLRELAQLRGEYDDKLRQAEANRIDAIRAVDVTAVQQTAAAAETRATALAAVVAASAEALRNQVSEAATASNVSLSAALVPIQEAISDLRRAQYQAQGEKTQVVESRAGVSSATAVVGAVVGVLVLLLALVSLYLGTRKATPTPVVVNPTVTVPAK